MRQAEFNKLGNLPRRDFIQQIPDTRECVVAALDTTDQQEPDAGIEAELEKLRGIRL